MKQGKPTRGFALSLLIAGLALLSSVAGLVHPGVYRDNLFVESGWLGNDLVTLLVAVPLLAWAAWAGDRSGSRRAALVELGMLHYMLYNFAFYLFGAALNALFLLYVALFTLPVLALFFRLLDLDVSALGRGMHSQRLARVVGGYMVLWALCIGGLWVGQSLNFALTGEIPPILVAIGHPQADVTNLVAALDLSLLVPPVALAAVGLLRRRDWGVVLATAMSVSGAAYTLVLSAASLAAARAGVPGVLEQVPLWLILTLTSATAAGWLLLRAGDARGTSPATAA